MLRNLNPIILSQFRPYRHDINPNWIWGVQISVTPPGDMPASTSDCTNIRSCKWPGAGHWAVCNQTNGKQTYVSQMLIMNMKLLAFLKVYSLQLIHYVLFEKPSELTFFFKFDLENDILTMTFMYNHFENKCNQFRHLENPTIDTKIVKFGPWTTEICHFRSTIGGHLGFGWKRGLKGAKNLNPMIFVLFDS